MPASVLEGQVFLVEKAEIQAGEWPVAVQLLAEMRPLHRHRCRPKTENSWKRKVDYEYEKIIQLCITLTLLRVGSFF